MSSSVLELPIESYFPTTAKQGGLQEEKDSLSVMFNCTIFPRESYSSSDERIHLFRSALMPAGYLESMKIPERKNHYVALCALKDASLEVFDLQSFISKPVTLSTFLSATKARKASVMTTPSTALTPSTSSPRFTPTSTSSTISKENLSLSSSVSKKSKKKQMVLDTLLPKKRKLEETDSKDKEQSKQKCRDGEATSLDTKLTSIPSEPSLQVACLKEGTTTNPHSEQSKFSNDIGNFINISRTEQLKYHILCNVWSPPSNYNFPVNEEKRRFRFEWSKIFPWLTYSEKFDGAFCLNCVLFGSESATMHNTTKLQRLFKLPLRSWNIATARFREHSEKSELHKTATTRAAMFKTYMENKSTPIDAMLDKVKKQQIEENRKQLRPIIRAIILCGRQNIALRAHRDDSKYHLLDDANPGNFIEVLKYGVTCAGQSLEEYFTMTPKNLTYRSKTTQNEIIDICDELITNKITDEIREAKFFSILADEASDCGNVEQLSVVIRFVDRPHRIREEFLGFFPCKNGVSGEAIAKTIQDFLRERGLSIDDCRGQGYDGVGKMAGRISGAAAKIQAIQNKAIYVHCNSHILNLCVASCCKELLVSNMLEHVRVVSEFFNFSPKRFEDLVKTIKEMLPDANHTRLINVCKMCSKD